MIVNVAGLRKSRGGRETFHITEVPDAFTHQGATIEFHRPAEIDVTVRNTGRGLDAHIEADLEARLICDRCLTPFRWPVHVAYDEFYVTPEEAQAEGEDARDGEVRRVVLAGDELHLDEGLRQNLIMALPMKMLCREECRGLCPKCGRNLNEETCDCAEERSDPRLAVLRQWLDRQGN